jgi:hypothetical protein
MGSLWFVGLQVKEFREITTGMGWGSIGRFRFCVGLLGQPDRRSGFLHSLMAEILVCGYRSPAIGFAYDVPLSKYRSAFGNSFEVMLNYAWEH